MKIKKLEVIRWTTEWAFNNMNFEYMPLYNTKRKLDVSPNRFQLGYAPIKVKITIKKIK